MDFMKDISGVFEPTDDWKTVEPGQLCSMSVLHSVVLYRF